MNNAVSILLIEDNAFDEELTVHALQQYRVANHIKVVRDGQEALDYLFGSGQRGQKPGHPPTVILLDLKLPKVDGLEILRRAKADARTRDIPVVVMTSSREDWDMLESQKLGATSYITKPVNFEQFAETVRHLGFYWLLLQDPPKGEPAPAYSHS